MSLQSSIVAQFGRPSGPVGRLAGLIMARRPSNRRRNIWTIDLLAFAGGETVLELGCGPGLAVEAALGAGVAHVLALDHSAEMVRQATGRNRAAVRAGRVTFRTGGLEILGVDDHFLDAAWMANVAQFLPDRRTAFRRIGECLRPAGRLAVTHQPRQRGATAADAEAFADVITTEMIDAGFADVERHRLPLVPVPAICVLGTLAEGDS